MAETVRQIKGTRTLLLFVESDRQIMEQVLQTHVEDLQFMLQEARAEEEYGGPEAPRGRWPGCDDSDSSDPIEPETETGNS